MSSSSCSSVPSKGAPLGSTNDGEACFWQLARTIRGEANRPIPQIRITSLLLREFLLVVMVRWWPCSLLRDFQRRLNTLARIRSNPQRDFCRLDGELLLVIPDCECIRAQKKGHFSRFAGSKGNALKLTQDPHGLSNACSLKAEIALHRFHTRTGSGVGDICAGAQDCVLFVLANLQAFIQGLGAHLHFVDVEISIAEGCV